jgi:hypothetical protein
VPAQPSSASPYSAPPTWQPGQRRVYADGYNAPPPNVSANSKHLVVALRMLMSKLCIHSPLLSLSHRAHSLDLTLTLNAWMPCGFQGLSRIWYFASLPTLLFLNSSCPVQLTLGPWP